MRYLIAYDISDPKRLRRVARCLEKKALRIQKSVFMFDGDENSLMSVLGTVLKILNTDEDIFQAWRLAKYQQATGILLGSPVTAYPDAIVVDRSSFPVSRKA